MSDKTFLLKLLLLAHLLADFVFQSKKMAEKKDTGIKYMLMHAFIYVCVMLTGFLFVKAEAFWLPFVIIIISHCLIDILKAVILNEKLNERLNEKHNLFVFIVDQLFHVSVLYGMVCLFTLGSQTTQTFTEFRSHWLCEQTINYSLILVTLWKPCSIFVRKLFEVLNIKEEVKEEAPYELFDFMRTQDKSGADRRPNAGSAIGILERLIIAALILIGQPGAIGFVLTAKTIARFKELENKAFAEKYLIGTLASVLLALFVTLVYKRFA